MQEWDHAAKVAGQLDFIEQNIVEFWKSQGLPTEVCQGRHPSADANKASELGLSWAMWRYVRDARRALAAGDQHLAFRVGWLMGRLDGEAAWLAVMAGTRGAAATRKRRPRAHESQRENIAERLGPREAEIRRLDSLILDEKSKTARARRIKNGWNRGDDDKEPGLDRWLAECNRNLAEEYRIATLSEDRISRRLPTRK